MAKRRYYFELLMDAILTMVLFAAGIRMYGTTDNFGSNNGVAIFLFAMCAIEFSRCVNNWFRYMKSTGGAVIDLGEAASHPQP